MIQFLANGFITGILYSMLAIGFALVYNTTRIFHIVAAALYVISAYVFYTLAVQIGLPLIISVFGAMIVTMMTSLGTEAIIYRPLKKCNASLNVMMIASIGLMTILINLITMVFGNETKVIDNTIHSTFKFADIIITTPQIYQLTIGVVMIALFFLLLSLSRFGLKLRALSIDDDLLATMGCSVKKMRNIVFLLSGGFISAASCLTVYDIGLDPHMGMNVLINAMVAMIIGGIGRLGTCVLGGIILGITQSLVVYQFASNWQNAITFILLVILLFLRPQGIAGYKQRTV